MFGYDVHQVSTKAALYATDNSAVLVLKYPQVPKFEYGLAGGHIDAGEVPDQAMLRELSEELNLENIKLEHRDFFAYSSGKIVLGYTGTIDKSAQINSPNPGQEYGVWLTRHEFEQIDIDPGYREFVLKFWPNN